MNDQMVDADAFDRFEATGWDQRAVAYEQFFVTLTSRAIGPLLDAAGVGPDKRVLDLCSGPGHVADACANRGAKVTGIDIAPGMVALASRRYPRISYQQGDVQQLPFSAESMDAVVGNFAILHVGRPERVADEAARVLVPGGSLALSTWDVPARCRIIGVLTDAVGEAGAVPPPDVPAGPPFFRFSDDGEFTRLLTEAGFTDVRVRTIAFRHHMGTVAELWQGLTEATVRTRALVLGQTDEVQAGIRAGMERLAGEYTTADGLDLPVSMKIASGVRP
jgi:SAM-dependent methyltransferase